MSTLIDSYKPEFQKVISHLDKELRNIRSGRANSSIVEDIKIEAYGSLMELKGLASISVPDAKTIQIEPWDKAVVKEIEKGLIAANIGMAPNVTGTIIRLCMPPMSEENRKNTVKTVNQKGEQAKIGLRGVREEIREKILQQEKEKSVTEDERYRLMEELDKIVGEFNKQIDQTVKDKEQEIMTV